MRGVVSLVVNHSVSSGQAGGTLFWDNSPVPIDGKTHTQPRLNLIKIIITNIHNRGGYCSTSNP